MNSSVFIQANVHSKDEIAVCKLYQRLLDSWNNRNASDMAETFMEDGEQIGFDGSQIKGRKDIFSHLQPIFADHPTPPFVSKIRVRC